MADVADISRRPLFVTSIARSGSTLLCRLLNQHEHIRVASDPLLPLMGMMRTRIVEAAREEGLDVEPPAGCFPDYYFTEPRIQALRAVLAANLDLSVDAEFVSLARRAVSARASIEHPELAGVWSDLRGKTCEELLTACLQRLETALATPSTEWVGVKEVWILELLPALLRAFPLAKFIVLLRDPRATLSSMVALRDVYPDEAGHTLSYARHWRKYVALLRHFERDATTSRSLLSVRYEELVDQPESTWRKLCEFLDVKVSSLPSEMLGPPAERAPVARDHTAELQGVEVRAGKSRTARAWAGNSSYQDSIDGISRGLRDRWKRTFPEFDRRITELVCGPEMKLAGYELEQAPSEVSRPYLVDALEKVNRRDYCWRSDLRSPQRDIDCEFERLEMVRATRNESETRQETHFLFSHVLDALQDQMASRDVA